MMTEEELLPFCECGKCGLRVAKKGNRFIYNHHRRGISPTAGTIVKMSAWQLGVPHTSEAQLSADKAKRGVPHTSENQIAADKAKVGVPRSPETCAAMSAAKAYDKAAVKYFGEFAKPNFEDRNFYKVLNQ